MPHSAQRTMSGLDVRRHGEDGELPFTKMTGAGNDFVVLDNRAHGFSDGELSHLAERLCPRRTGIGADGLLALDPPRDEAHDYRMRYFNADGSRATMCGNGARCLARFAAVRGIGNGAWSVDSDAGTYAVETGEEGRMRLRMPVPEDPHEVTPRERPDPSCRPVYRIWAGTEHAVLFYDRIEDLPVAEWGRALRRDPVFAPEGTNVNFVARARAESAERGVRIRVRTYEKGVEGETPACGTGAVASAWATHRLHAPRTRRFEVEAIGGRLLVHWTEASPSHLYLEGEARIVYEGRVEVPV